MKNVMLRAICWLVFGLSMADAAVDFNSLSNAVVTGYQGWHWATGDGSPYNKWNHWVTNTSYRPGPTNCHMDMFPDMTEYTKQYDTDFYTPEGTRMKVFSAVDYSTVDLHFKWMRDYNIDSAFVQRFVSRFKGGYTTQGQNTDIVLSNACKAAEAYGRSFVVMYDVSDQNWSNDATLYITLTNDWISRAKQYTNSPNYQHHKGKPLAVVWGMGNTDRFPASPKVALDIVNFFKTNGCTVMGGVDKNWRTLSSGHRTNVDAGVTWSNVNNSYDVISPWLVGSFGAGTNGADSIKSLLSNDVVNCNSRGVDYMPVVFPGFSWANWQDGAGDEFNSRPRLGGNYLWRQAYNAKMAGAKMLYLAMFDEVDESTALFKTTDMEETSPQVISTPTRTNRWVRQDIDGYSLPSDWYLQVCGEINRMFKGQRSTVKDIPFVLNTRPVITSTPVTSADAGLLYSYAFTATDAQTNVVNYSAVSLPAWLTFNTNTAVLSGTPTVNDVGFYSVTLRASDMYGRTNQSFMIRVGTVGNDLPSITSTPGTRAMENQLYSYTVSAIDLDGDTLSYSAPIKPSWLSFNPTTRVLSGTPSSSALGLNPVSLTVYDGKSTVTQQFNVAVFAASVWSNLVQNGSFEAGSTTPTSWTVGSNSTRSAENVQDGFSALKLTTSPGNTTQVIPLQTNTNYKLSFWLNAGGMTSGGIRFDTNDKFDQGTVPGGTCQFTINMGQALTWTNYTGTFNSSNQTSVTLRIYQGSMVGTVYFDNVILEVAGTSNNPPLVTSVPVTQGTQDKAYTYTLLAADAESSSLTLSGVTVPSWLSFNTTNGVLSGTPSLAHVGTHPVSLRVSDGVNAIVHSFSITVAAKASVPVTVPDVVGMAQNAARLMITNADLVTGTISSNYSTIIPAGSVISQNPTSGVVVASGSSVDLVISQGPRMVTTPDVVGQTQSAAQSSITSADLTVGTISQASSETVPAGSVISQNPAGGSIVAEGSAVALTVSSGYPSLTTNTWTSTGSSFWTNNAGWSGGAAPLRQTQNMRVVFNVTGTAECILNTAAVVAQLSMGDNGTISNNFLRLKSGADLYCGINPTNGTVWTAIGYNRSATATVETGAVLRTAANMLIGFSGTNTSHLNIQGGTVNSASTITLGHTNNLARGFITIDVGGLLTASGFTINNTGCVVDVRGGTIVLNGNLTNTVNGYIAAGTLKAYGGSSTLNVDYNTINTGKTTISAVTLVTVPNVVNQAEATARTSITGTGLVVGTVTSNYSMTVAAGNVISQTPAGSTSIAIGSSVNFEVSLGVQMVTVPNVVNQAQAAARTSITNAGLVVGTVTSNYSMTVAAGNVISQTPAGSTSIAIGSSVDMVISLGVQMVTVPNVVDQTQAAARTSITNAGLVVGTVTSNYSMTIAAGNVISQTPAGSTSIAIGSSVDMVVSQGPRMVTTPDVVGLTQSAAQSSLTSADLTVGTVSQISSEIVPAGTVMSQNPTGGSLLAEGSPVALTVSSGYPSQTTNTWNSSVSSVWTNNANWTGGAAPLRQTQNMKVIFNVNGAAECILNTAVVVAQLSMGDNGTISNNFLRLQSGADLYSGIDPTNGTVWTAIGYNRSATAIVETGAVLRTAANLLVGYSGTNTSHLNIQGGTVNSASTITLGHTNNLARGFITIDVGGLLTASGFTINNTGCVVDVRGGTIVLNGNQISAVNGYIAAGTLKAYGGSSTFNVDYDTINSGKTTISAVPLVTVPDVVNQTQTAARTSITNAGLVVGTVTSNYSMTIAAGNVISQTPVGNISIPMGSPVDMVISLGVQMVTVPNVVNQAQASARTSITNAGLVVGTVTSNYSMTVAAGNVISQTPAGSTSIAIGSSVNMVISLGVQMVTVPNVVNQAQAAARTSITNAGLVVGTVTSNYSMTIAAGNVISQTPAGSTSIAIGSSVDMVISLGVQMVTVPNVVNQAQAAARTSITNAGLVVGTVTSNYSMTVAAGNVISQTPAGSTSIAIGSSVDMVISLGVQMVTVPNVVNQTQAAARTSITNAGLVVGTVTSNYSMTIAAGNVISQTPAGSTSIAIGSSVDMVISLGVQMVTVPNVVNQAQAAARTSITNAGLVVGTVTSNSSETVAAGLVLSQTPSASVSIAVGSAVDLVISSGYPSMTTNTWTSTGSSEWTNNAGWSAGAAPIRQTQNLKVVFNVNGAVECILRTNVTVAHLVVGDNGTTNGNFLRLKSGANLYCGINATNGTMWTAVGYNRAATVTVETGAIFEAASTLYVGFNGNGTTNPQPSYLDILGGSVYVNGNLQMGTATAGQENSGGYITIDNGGLLDIVGNLVINDTLITGSGVNVRNGTILLQGDKTNAVNTLVSAGLIVAYGGSGTLTVVYNSVSGDTVVTAQPPLITVSFTSVAAEDGYVTESTETSNVGNAMNATDSTTSALRIGDTTKKFQMKSVVSFDTASIPDGAVIQSATLKLLRGTVSGTPTTLGAIRVDIQSGSGFSNSVALQTGDFQASASATNVATLSYPASNGTWSTGSVSTNGLTHVNKTGKTQLRVYFATDDDNDGTADYLGFYSAENATTTNRPVLEVIYR